MARTAEGSRKAGSAFNAGRGAGRADGRWALGAGSLRRTALRGVDLAPVFRAPALAAERDLVGVERPGFAFFPAVRPDLLAALPAPFLEVFFTVLPAAFPAVLPAVRPGAFLAALRRGLRNGLLAALRAGFLAVLRAGFLLAMDSSQWQRAPRWRPGYCRLPWRISAYAGRSCRCSPRSYAGSTALQPSAPGPARHAPRSEGQCRP